MSITWNGVSSDTIGVIVERIPNRYVPTRRFSPQQVAGRNGNILLVDKAFPNVEQEYEVYLSAESQGLPSVARACAEWLMGPDGYCRLTDSYDTTVYREAFLLGGFDIENILNKFGRCTITFSCKPQKYLLTGDTPIEIPDGTTTTYTGDVVQFDVITGASITSLSTAITPTQDLHGYSSPWPAGGGVNKFYCANNATASAHGVTCSFDASTQTFTVDGTNDSSSAYVLLMVTPTAEIVRNTPISRGFIGAPSGIYVNLVWYDGAWHGVNNGGTIPDTVELSNIRVQVGVYGNATTIPLTAFKFQLQEGSTAPTSYSPYSNLCPITGRTGLSVYRTGNPQVWDEQWEVGDISASNGQNVNGSTTIRTKNYISVVPDKTYYCHVGVSTTANMRARWYDANHNFIGTSPNVPYNGTFTVPSNAYYLRFTPQATYGTTYNNDISINYPSTDTDYHAYNGSTYSVDWTTQAGTVYGGTLDVVTGVLTVTMATVDLGTLTWRKGTEHKFYATTTGVVVYKPYTPQMLCDTYKFAGVRSASPWYGDENELTCYYVGTGNVRELYINDPAYTDVTEFQTAMSGVQLVYELATPLTYQLTPQEIEALVGTNNVWSSSGDVSVTVTTTLGGTVTNPTPFEARPLLEVSGVGEITINGKSIQILESVSDFEIDCETMEAEDNSKIYCMDFPELSGGENEIVSNGSITALTVTPRWWTL